MSLIGNNIDYSSISKAMEFIGFPVYQIPLVVMQKSKIKVKLINMELFNLKFARVNIPFEITMQDTTKSILMLVVKNALVFLHL